MSNTAVEPGKEELLTDRKLLIERIAERLGFGYLSNRLPGDIPSSYLFVTSALVFQMGILDSYNYFVTGKHSIADDPGRVLIFIGTFLAVVGVRWMQNKYMKAVADLRLSQRDDDKIQKFEEQFKCIIPLRVKLLTYGIALAALYTNLFVNLGFSTAVEINGIVRVVTVKFLILPLVQIPLIVEFGLIYFGIHFLLPKQIARADLDLFFYDPRNMGGFASLGQLFKKSYYLYTGGLLLYFVIIYWPLLLSDVFIINHPYPEPGAIVALFFSIFWLLGIISIGYSMYKTHSVMSRKKEQAITEIEEEIRELVDTPYDINTDHIENKETREEIQHRLTEIRETREYPSTFTMWSQIAVSVLLPQALQLAIQVVP